MVGSLKKTLPLLDQGIVSGGNALIQILLVRILGLDQYGVMAFVLIFVLGAVALNQSFIVLPFQVLYDKSNDLCEEREINSIQVHVVVLFLVLLVLLGVLNEFFCFIERLLFIVSAIYGIGYLIHDFVRKRLYVQENYKKALFLDFLVFLSSLTAVFFLYFSGLDLTYILISFGGIYFFFSVLFFGPFSFATLNKSRYEKHWSHAKWLCASTVTQWFSGNIILSTAGVIMGPWVLGVIRMGQTINGVLGVMFQLMESYFPSKVAAIYNREGFKPFLSYLYKIGFKTTLFTSALALIIIFLRKPLMQVMYGKEGLQHAYIIYWFGFLLVINVLNILIRFYIRTLNMNRIIFESYVILAVLSILSAKYIAQNWGIQGICFGLVANQFLSLIWFLVRIKTIKKPVHNFS